MMSKEALAATTMSVVVAATSLLGGSPAGATSPSEGSPSSTGIKIRVNGYTMWPETYQVIRELNKKWGIPISSDLCRPNEEYCITIQHENVGNYTAGRAYLGTSNPTVILNNYYDKGWAYRKAVLYHELGHALGLYEHSGCDSSMTVMIKQCGYYVHGYSPTEYSWLLNHWN